MSALVLFVRERLCDLDLFEAYVAEASATVAGHDVKLLARNGECVTLEAAETAAVLILQVADVAAARAWYASPAYQAVRGNRHLSADYRVIITGGI